MAALFSAVDISSITTGIGTILVAVISLGLLFVGFRYIRKAGVR